MFQVLKRLVSENRQRYIQGDIDLDLSYVTERIIAMSYPSEGIEGLYRNSLVEVKRFLDTRHSSKFKIFNLREEKLYHKAKFDGNVTDYPFKDHQIPGLQMIQEFCQDAANWLEKDPENVVVVHCKAGKGRTGVMICSLLLYLRQAKTSEEAVAIYGNKRTNDGLGVTIPSQLRYIKYFESMIDEYDTNDQPLLLTSLRLSPIPTRYQGNNGRWVLFSILNSDQKTIYDQDDEGCNITRSPNQLIIETPGMKCIRGDFKIQFYYLQLWKRYRLCHFWLNTKFMQPVGEEQTQFTHRLSKAEIDQAYSDTSNKVFDKDFSIELHFTRCHG